MRTWPILLAMQNAVAYGAGIGDDSKSADETRRLAADWCSRLPDLGEGPRGSLIIGPGGPTELRNLRGALPEPINVLTAHTPELEACAGLGCSLTLGDLHDMPFLSGAFEFVYASNVLEHALSPYAAIIEIRRVLRLGGRANLVMPSFEGREGGVGPFHLHCLTREVWEELLRKCGLAVADVVKQVGVDDTTAYYMHFHCIATAPLPPHDRVLNELVTLKGVAT